MMRLQCDEAHPHCGTCVLRQQTCEYSTTIREWLPQPSWTGDRSIDPRLGRETFSSASAQSSRRLEGGLTRSIRVTSTLSRKQVPHPRPGPDFPLSDLTLFDHYMRHTCHSSGLSGSHAHARKIGLPTLASKNRGVLCSLLAFGAACLCVDLLEGPTSASVVAEVERLIEVGDCYHGRALVAVKSQLRSGDSQSLETAHAHTAILMGYPPARRRIFRLLGLRKPDCVLHQREPDADAPHNMEWAYFLRGMKTVTGAYDTLDADFHRDQEHNLAETDVPDAAVSEYITQAVKSEKDKQQSPRLCPGIGRVATDLMVNAMASSVSEALDMLEDQVSVLEKMLRRDRSNDISPMLLLEADPTIPSMGALRACLSAVISLETTAHEIFDLPATPGTRYSLRTRTRRERSGIPQDQWFGLKRSPWLHRVQPQSGGKESSESVIRSIFSWIGHLPNEYFELITRQPPDQAKHARLTIHEHIACLAWDIYAHWLAFTFLLEDEIWWWADLGQSDIQKLLGRGHGEDSGEQQWWPWRMWQYRKLVGVEQA